MLGIAAMLASCNQNEELSALADNEELTLVSFTVNAKQGMQTRTVTDDADEAPKHAVLAIYYNTRTLVEQIEGTLMENGSFTFNTRLNATKTYTCLFWAETTKGDYNTTNLREVTYAEGKTPSLAFSGKLESFKPTDASYDVTLTHAVAKLVVKETGTLTAGNVIGVSFARPNYTYNVESGTSTLQETTTDVTISHTGAEGSLTGELAYAYMLTPTTGTTVNEVTLSYKSTSDGTAKTTTMANVPLQANNRTLLQGEFENIGVTLVSQPFSVTCDKEWTGDESAGM